VTRLTCAKCPVPGWIAMSEGRRARTDCRDGHGCRSHRSGVADFNGSETAGPIPHDSMPVAGSEHALKAARWNALRTSSLKKAPALSSMWLIALATTGGRSPEALRPPALGWRSLCQGGRLHSLPGSTKGSMVFDESTVRSALLCVAALSVSFVGRSPF
jgi:hypothetical protein